jgi:cytochrome c biogenesis protein CcmG, thiol:disulfide interchange protein DsbE
VLLRLKAMGVEVDGIAVHDTPEALQAFLAKNGNPYSRIGSDDQSRIQLMLGSSGVPETFVVDGKGMIVHQHIGVVSERDIPQLLGLLGQQ